MIFAAAALAIVPHPLAADVVSLSQTINDSEGLSAFVTYTVAYANGQPYISSGSNSYDLGNWSEAASGGCCGPPWLTGTSPLDFPSLPAGSTINSAALTFSVGFGGYIYTSNQQICADCIFSIEGSTAPTIVNLYSSNLSNQNPTPAEAIDCPFGGGQTTALGCWGNGGELPIPPNGVYSFVPASTSEQFYYPQFVGGDMTLVVNPFMDSVGDDLFPSAGTYSYGVDVDVSVDYTISVDYTVAPEPNTYAFLIGFVGLGIFAIKRRGLWKGRKGVGVIAP